MLVAISLLMILGACQRAEANATGPINWYQKHQNCGGKMQSPIDISTKNVVHDPFLELFNLTEYEKTSGVIMHLANVGGHTARVLYSGTAVYIRGGSLPDKYQLDQFHFHWAKEDLTGSEHSVDWKHYPLEMHIVHHQAGMGTLQSAAARPHGLAVIAFFFKVCRRYSLST
ncbi:carbonic anhydrase 2 [Aplysia californica]|uniref:Carbonic anhydrase n=1 Tax=Aplysia californica TaxID=6500 RepID=A0ABM0JJR8_APLCA|nr:carbonic anhydrase 2 [Aplysia californica]